jgi:hypothetical protein
MDISLSWLIEHLYPGAIEAENVVLQDDGQGAYIRYWNEAALGPQPSQAQLEAAALPAAKKRKKWQLAWAADEQAKAEIPLFPALVVAAKYGRSGLPGLAPEERVIFDKISAGNTKLNGLLAQVDAATTVGQVEGVHW